MVLTIRKVLSWQLRSPYSIPISYMVIIPNPASTNSAASTTMYHNHAFDAHNHLHLSLPGGIPPLSCLSDEDSNKKHNSLLNTVDEDFNNIIIGTNRFQERNDTIQSKISKHAHLIIKSIIPNHNSTTSESANRSSTSTSITKVTLGGMAFMSTQPRDFPIVDSLASIITSHYNPTSTYIPNNNEQCNNKKDDITKLSITDTNPQFKIIRCYGVHPWFLHQAESDFDHICLQNVNEEDKVTSPNTITSYMSHESIHNISPPFKWLNYLYETLSHDPNSQVGEIGLDGAHYDPVTKHLPTPMHRQIQAFELQLHLAADLNKSVSIHAVKSWGPLMDTMQKVKRERKKQRDDLQSRIRQQKKKKKEIASSTSGEVATNITMMEEIDKQTVINEALVQLPILPPRIYFHAFGGKTAVVDQLDAICRGVSSTYYGFAPVINFRSPKTKEIVKKIGIDRLVLETDLEDPTCVMSDMCENIDFVSEALNVDRQVVVEKTYANAMRFYGLASSKEE